ncbi:PAAR domain-containing protein [Ralstonia sp. 1138]|uniref:PAAR domain-containing protein n=1 Tax=Ralstonia sp. 1138 TaxID=3156423 RepID=UPI00339B3EFE
MAHLGDKTDHGGEIIEASPDFHHQGAPVALDGHRVWCPQCQGSYPIIASGSRKFRGIRVAYLGDLTACGATLLGAE